MWGYIQKHNPFIQLPPAHKLWKQQQMKQARIISSRWREKLHSSHLCLRRLSHTSNIFPTTSFLTSPGECVDSSQEPRAWWDRFIVCMTPDCSPQCLGKKSSALRDTWSCFTLSCWLTHKNCIQAEIQTLPVLREINCVFLTTVFCEMNSLAAKSWLFTTQLGQTNISYDQFLKYSLVHPTSERNQGRYWSFLHQHHCQTDRSDCQIWNVKLLKS